MKKAVIKLEELACPTCMQKIESAAAAVPGVDRSSIQVLFNASKLKVNFNEAETTVAKIQTAIEELGYPVVSTKVQAV